LGIILALTFEFVPAELVLPLAGYCVYEGDPNLYGAIFAGSIGGVLSLLTLYALGRYGGRVKTKHTVADCSIVCSKLKKETDSRL
jgi:membrane protein DedA with SNARE-associated domain